MSDARSQTLLRSALASGSVSDRAAWLSEWLRTDPACSACSGPLKVGDAVRLERAECSACCGTGTERRWRVELAAHCADSAARQALGGEWLVPDPPVLTLPSPMPSGHVYRVDCSAVDRMNLEDWTRLLSRWGHEVVVRGALAMVEGAYSLPRSHPAGPTYSDSVNAVRAWLDCPCDAHLVACRAVTSATRWFGSTRSDTCR